MGGVEKGPKFSQPAEISQVAKFCKLRNFSTIEKIRNHPVHKVRKSSSLHCALFCLFVNIDIYIKKKF